MIKYKMKATIVFLAIDITSTIIAVALAVWGRFYSGVFTDIHGIIYTGFYFTSIALIIPIVISINFFASVYKKYIEIDFFAEIGRILLSHTFSIFILMSLTFMMKEGGYLSRWVIVLFYVIHFAVNIGLRTIFRFALRRQYQKDTYKIVVLGTGKLAHIYLESIKKYNIWGQKVVGFLTPAAGVLSGTVAKEMLLGTFEDFSELHRLYNFDEVVVALHINEAAYIEKIMQLCDLEGVRIKIIPGYYEHLKYSTTIEELDGLPVLTVRGVPLDFMSKRALKRLFDICFSLLALMAVAPLMILIAIGIKITSKEGPIFFLQERVGHNNNPFTMIKFRTMHIQKPEDEKFGWSKENDPRVTKFGNFLRKTSLDELPQFFNTLSGAMSVVGPRPERPYWVEKFKQNIPGYMLRHYVKSGITGWAQVNGLRGDTSIEERIKFDNYYIQNWSLWFDIKIIFMTAFKGMKNKY